jgi:hypothetical protein
LSIISSRRRSAIGVLKGKNMKKMTTVFIREGKPYLATPVVAPGCEWVLEGKGVATKKWDGMATAIIGGKFYKRFQGSKYQYGDSSLAIKVDEGIYWVPVGIEPQDQYLREALENYIQAHNTPPPSGTYEACGPKINRNAEGLAQHQLIPHGVGFYPEEPGRRSFQSIKARLSLEDTEGFVYYHPDGRMAKIKKKDFGLDRKPDGTETL